MRPEVTVPRVVRPVTVRVFDTYSLVVVALLVVALTAVKFWRVVDPVRSILANVARPVNADVPRTANGPPT